MPKSATSGSGAGETCAARRERRISSRLLSAAPPVDFAEAVRWRLGQLALPAPCVPSMVDQRPWQSAKQAAHQPAEESVGPGPGEDPAANGGSHSLFDGDEVGAPKLASPNQELMVQIDLHRTDVAARAAQRGCERQAGVGSGIEVWR